MPITGELFIGAERVATAQTFKGMRAETHQEMPTAFSVAGASEISRACELAATCFDAFRELPLARRAEFLEAIATEIDTLGSELLELAGQETGLAAARLTGERSRTTSQLRMFAELVRRGEWIGARIDPALPDRKPVARPDLRQRKIPLGPVAVFGASNFPLAFSVAGGDTAAALAAGCPVVFKGHPAHPATSELIAVAINAAARRCNVHAGVFSLLNGPGHELGAALVADPHIKAVAFTGSRTGGTALVRIAAGRAEPIPVFAELSSVNPVILLPGALRSRAEALGREFVGSLTLGAGQFCTNPGLVLAVAGPDLERFVAAAADALSQTQPAVMLTAGIQQSYENAVAARASQAAVKTLSRGTAGGSPRHSHGALFGADARTFLGDPALAHEIFGATALLVECSGREQLQSVLQSLEGQLTATLHLDAEDHGSARALLPILERKAGRILVNGWPTGVEVSHAMVHGGPFPATSDSRGTSVGSLAIERFLRPVCYQNLPSELLPDALRDDNPGRLSRRVDGIWQPS